MLHSGNFGKLKSVEWDIFDEVYTGDESDLFHPDGNFSGILRDPTTTTTTATTTVIASGIFSAIMFSFVSSFSINRACCAFGSSHNPTDRLHEN